MILSMEFFFLPRTKYSYHLDCVVARGKHIQGEKNEKNQ